MAQATEKATEEGLSTALLVFLFNTRRTNFINAQAFGCYIIILYYYYYYRFQTMAQAI